MTNKQFIDALNATHSGYTFSISNGPKYTRVIQESPGSRSVYCFLDAQGDIYKAASWKVPAKGIRGNLATLDVSKTDPYGSWLYRLSY